MSNGISYIVGNLRYRPSIRNTSTFSGVCSYERQRYAYAPWHVCQAQWFINIRFFVDIKLMISWINRMENAVILTFYLNFTLNILWEQCVLIYKKVTVYVVKSDKIIWSFRYVLFHDDNQNTQIKL